MGMPVVGIINILIWLNPNGEIDELGSFSS